MATSSILQILATCFLVFTNHQASTAKVCPVQCTCSDDVTNINCSGASLQNLPNLDSFRDGTHIYELDLSHNENLQLNEYDFNGLAIDRLKLSFCELRILRNGVFQNARITTLFLDNNPLQFSSDEFSLAGLETSLQHLILRRTKMTKVFRQHLHPLSSLIELDLSKNSIKEIHQEDFLHLRAKRIYLNDNEITSIHEDSFNTVPIVEHLDLSHNQITDVSFLGQVCKFEKVNLSGNPIHCDCNFVVNRKLETGEKFTGICASPDKLKGINLENMEFIETGSKVCSVGGVPNVECYSPEIPQDSNTDLNTSHFVNAKNFRVKSANSDNTVLTPTNNAQEISSSLIVIVITALTFVTMKVL